MCDQKFRCYSQTAVVYRLPSTAASICTYWLLQVTRGQTPQKAVGTSDTYPTSCPQEPYMSLLCRRFPNPTNPLKGDADNSYIFIRWIVESEQALLESN